MSHLQQSPDALSRSAECNTQEHRGLWRLTLFARGDAAPAAQPTCRVCNTRPRSQSESHLHQWIRAVLLPAAELCRCTFFFCWYSSFYILSNLRELIDRASSGIRIFTCVIFLHEDTPSFTLHANNKNISLIIKAENKDINSQREAIHSWEEFEGPFKFLNGLQIWPMNLSLFEQVLFSAANRVHEDWDSRGAAESGNE